jgi:hypothetical protein
MSGELRVDQRTLALLLACLLASVTMLGLESSPPSVTVSQLPHLEDGMKVRIKGLLVDLWKYETGSESLVLAEPGWSGTLRVVSSPATLPQPSRYADLGDELVVLGDLSKSGSVPTVYSTSDRISVSKESEDILTVDMLRDNWMLFEGDSVRLRCVLYYDGLRAGLRLFNPGKDCSLAANMGGLDASRFVGSQVLVTGTLAIDQRTLSLALTVSSIVADP